MTDSSPSVLSSTSSKKVNSNHGYNGNGKKEWSCTCCTFLNSGAVPLCEMCNAHKPLSPLCWDFKSKEPLIDLTTVRSNDDGSPKRSENRSNSADENYRVSFTKMNSNHTWNVASTESARKRRKRKMSDNGRSANSDGHDTISNPKNMIVINDTDDDDEHNDVVSKSLRSKKISSLRNNMETGRFKSRHGDQVQTSSVVQSGHVNGGRIHDDEKHSKLDRSPNESLSSSSLCNKSKLQSTLFGSVLPDTKTRRQTEPSSDNIKKRSSRTASGSKRQDSWSDLEYSDEPVKTFKDKEENMPSTGTGSFTVRTGTIMANPSFSQARYDALMKQATVKMKSIFGISSLRNLQPIAIESALKGQSQIIIMATGGGKSLCYQLPAVVLPGLTVVVSPLIALMVDQVEQLKKKGVAAELICSSQSQKENQKVMQRLRDAALQQEKQKGGKKVKMESLQTVLPMVKLLYCTPELIQTTRFQDILTSLYRVNMLSLIVIDEAHCMSTWGHDFRPAYRKLSWLRTSFSNIPCMACTATATKKVIEEIKQVLCFQNGDKVHMSTFNRANIHYEVRYKDNMSEEDALQNLVQTIQEQHKTCKKNDNKCSGIVYVHKRQDTMMIASRLQQAGIVAAPYHAGLKDAERKRVQQEWTHGTIQVAIATVAFGMGIDLAHVRYVIHWTLSKSIEGFYQESGRAGRDGLPSLSILYYSRDDASKFAFLIRKNLENKQRSAPDKSSSSRDTMDALDKMIEYCTSTCCRRKYLLRHFGEEIDPKKVCRMTCDYCLHPQKVSDAMMSTTQGTSNISRAIRDVKRQSFGYMSSFYDHSNGSDDEEYNHVDHDILFQEWGYGDEDPGGAVVPPASPIHHYQNNKNDHHKKTTGAHAGFSTAGGTQIYNSGRRRNTTTTTTNILSKYETMEQQQQQSQPNTKLPYKNNHDKHKSNLWSKVMNQQEDDIPCKHPQHYRQQRRQQQQTSSSTSHIPIPSHLLPKSPNVQKTNPPKHNPNNNYNSTINTATTPSSSKDFASAADAVKAELEEIRKKRESLLAKFSKK